MIYTEAQRQAASRTMSDYNAFMNAAKGLTTTDVARLCSGHGVNWVNCAKSSVAQRYALRFVDLHYRFDTDIVEQLRKAPRKP